MFGKPPFTPADFIDIYIDDDEKVYLTFPQGLDRPLDLTAEEWNEVHLAVTRAIASKSQSQNNLELLQSLLNKFSSVPLDLAGTRPFESRYNLIKEALDENLQIEFKYRSLSSRESEVRRVDPWTLFINNGNAYMIGFCHLRDASRYFHLERIEDPLILDLEIENSPPDDLDSLIQHSPVFNGNQGGISVQAAFRKEVTGQASRIFKLNRVDPMKMKNGVIWYKADIRVPDRFWFYSVMKSFGPQACILGPDHIRESFLLELKQIPFPAAL
jgi:predicted DNA-binding transcriptional regulator YafY